MKVDFSKMTPEIHQKVLTARSVINESKKNIALMLLEIEEYQELEQGRQLKKNVTELLEKFNVYDVLLKDFEI
jgi:hypothetical protein